jgi:YtkA-like
MKRTAAIIAAIAGVLALAGTAQAGCWATVGIEPLPTGVAAGETWTVDVTVLQHGRTPMTDASPAVVITSSAGAQRRFPAQPSGQGGVYSAAVTFPEKGSWAVAVYDGFPVPECAQTHSFGSFPIDAGSGPSGSGPSEAAAPVADQAAASGEQRSLWPVWLAAGLGGAAMLVVLVFAFRTSGARARPPSPQAPRPAR